MLEMHNKIKKKKKKKKKKEAVLSPPHANEPQLFLRLVKQDSHIIRQHMLKQNKRPVKIASI